jgi:hypothetical protein
MHVTVCILLHRYYRFLSSRYITCGLIVPLSCFLKIEEAMSTHKLINDCLTILRQNPEYLQINTIEVSVLNDKQFVIHKRSVGLSTTRHRQ